VTTSKTKKQLVSELESLRCRVRELEKLQDNYEEHKEPARGSEERLDSRTVSASSNGWRGARGKVIYINQMQT